MTKQQKYMLYAAGGLLVLLVLYRMRSGSATTQSGPNPTNQSAADFAQLAGQEQTDIAGLAAQQQQDLATLSGQLTTAQGQEQADISSLTGQLAGITAQQGASANQGPTASTAPDQMQQALHDLQTQIQMETQAIQATIAAQALVPKPPNPVVPLMNGSVSTITTHKGGPFYNWFVTMFKKAPPKTLASNDWRYQAWQHGVKPSPEFITTTY